ncbi:MAG TPA: NAD(P)H-dependent oxidoreductase [Methylibium sp.]|nr:NAD(P)H-dependent oxidoreductase [Methylibium sp.]
MTAVRVLVIPGSVRQGGLNLALARHAAQRLAALGAEATLLDLRALALPIYDGDLEAEQGPPPGARTLVAAFAAHDAVLVVSPEYNALPTPLFINAIDWATRLPEHKAAMNGKPCALVSASPGLLGGMRSLLVLRNYLAINPGMLVIPPQFALGQAGKAYNAEGALADAGQQAALDAVLQALLKVAQALT